MLKVQSNVKHITSGHRPNTIDLQVGEIAFGLVREDGLFHIYMNPGDPDGLKPQGVIVDFITDGAALMEMTESILGGAKLSSNEVQTMAAQAISRALNRTYGIQANDAGQLVVNIPWTDTIYTHPSHTARASGFNKLTVDALGHVSDVSPITKADVVGLGIPAQDTVYTHPAYTARPSGFKKVTIDATGHVTDVVDVTKDDITALGIPAQDTIYTHPGDHGDRTVQFSAAGSRNNLANNDSISTIAGKVAKYFSDLRGMAWKDSIASDDLDSSILSGGKLVTNLLPDFILGQMVYGGTVTGAGVVTLSTNGKAKLGITSATVTLDNLADGNCGWVLCEGLYFIVNSSGNFAGLKLVEGDWLVSTGSGWKSIGVTDTAATATALGNVKLFSDTVQSVAAAAVSTTAARTYGVQLNAAGQLVVNVPWQNDNTVYTHPAYTAQAAGLNKLAVDALGHVTGITPITKADITGLGIPGQDTVYTHPSHTAQAAGLNKVTVDALGHVTGVTAITKADITGLGIPAQDTVYTHPAYTARAAGFNKVTVDATGHVTGIIAVSKDDIIALGIPGDASKTMTSTVDGLGKLFSDSVQTVAATAVSATASRTYGVQKNSSGQLVVNVPWTDTTTTYTHPSHTGDVTGASALTIAANAVTSAKIADAAVTSAKMANMPANTIKGRLDSEGVPQDLPLENLITVISGSGAVNNKWAQFVNSPVDCNILAAFM